MFWRSKFKQLIEHMREYDLGGLCFGCHGPLGSLKRDRRFDEIARYRLENGQKLKKSSEQASLKTLTDFSKWYLLEYASHKSGVGAYEPKEVTALENDYGFLRQRLLHLTMVTSPKLSTI